MAWTLLLFFAVALLCCFIWIWRVWQSRFGNRMMDYDSREMAFLAEARVAAPAAPREAADEGAALPRAAAMPSPAAPAIAPRTPADRPAALLDEAGRLVFRDLKTVIGDYPLSIAVDIARLINDSQVIPPRVQIDFVVCRKDFTPVVAIFLDRNEADPLRERALQLLKQSRIRVLRWQTHALPDAEAMRAQIFKSRSAGEAAS